MTMSVMMTSRLLCIVPSEPPQNVSVEAASSTVSRQILLARSARLERDLAIGGVSVCLSVRPSHAGIDSKLMIAGSCGFHRPVAHGL